MNLAHLLGHQGVAGLASRDQCGKGVLSTGNCSTKLETGSCCLCDQPSFRPWGSEKYRHGLTLSWAWQVEFSNKGLKKINITLGLWCFLMGLTHVGQEGQLSD
jgi:hypothetical protein